MERTGGDRGNNFDALRLVAAVSVIFSHAFLLSSGSQDGEPLYAATGGQCVLGVVGVFLFFVISGYLITQSWAQTGDLRRYAVKRALRIYPGYAACLLVLTFGLGPIATSLDLGAYLADPGTWDFLGQNLLMNVEHNSLPATWFTGFGIGNIVDGPLWSLPCELVMYAMVALLGATRLLRLPALGLLFAIGLVCIWFDTTRIDFIGSVGWLMPFFVAGMVLYRLRDRRILNGRLALLALAGLVASVPVKAFILLFPLFGGYLTIYLAFAPWLPRLPATRFGDLSYGLYIYGWPVEQAILRFVGPMPWWALFAIALPVTAILAFASWHLVEKRALRLKPAGAPGGLAKLAL